MAGRAPMLWIWYWVTAAMVQPSWTTGTTARSARSAATRLPHRVQPARRGPECEYLLREDFQRFWEYRGPSWAGKFLDEWTRRVMRSRLEPMKTVARTLR